MTHALSRPGNQQALPCARFRGSQLLAPILGLSMLLAVPETHGGAVIDNGRALSLPSA